MSHQDGNDFWDDQTPPSEEEDFWAAAAEDRAARASVRSQDGPIGGTAGRNDPAASPPKKAKRTPRRKQGRSRPSATPVASVPDSAEAAEPANDRAARRRAAAAALQAEAPREAVQRRWIFGGAAAVGLMIVTASFAATQGEAPTPPRLTPTGHLDAVTRATITAGATIAKTEADRQAAVKRAAAQRAAKKRAAERRAARERAAKRRAAARKRAASQRRSSAPAPVAPAQSAPRRVTPAQPAPRPAPKPSRPQPSVCDFPPC